MDDTRRRARGGANGEGARPLDASARDALSARGARSGRLVPALLWLCVALQVAAFAPAVGYSVAANRATREVLRTAERIPIPPRHLAAYRDLGRLALEIPEDAAVLLLDTGLVPCAYSFYLRPRPLVSLMIARREDLEPLRTLNPDVFTELSTYLDQREKQGTLFTPERLAEEVARARFVLFYPLEIEVDVPGYELEIVRREGWGSLYRVRPAGESQ